MSRRQEFLERAQAPGANKSELCREYGISRQTAHTLLKRTRDEGVGALTDRSRRPHSSPSATEQRIVDGILALRDEIPEWGARKLRSLLIKRKLFTDEELPAPSTIQSILLRNGRISPERSLQHKPMQRFERAAPNELWQMDFKGYVVIAGQQRCYPLTVCDDCSRFNLVLRSCQDMRTETVRSALEQAFGRYGMPERMLFDNGSPWSAYDHCSRHTPLSVWLMRLGIGISRGRPYHPQTQGKIERFHGTLKRELLSRTPLESFDDAQQHFDRWRERYNTERPHDALDGAVPAERYTPSQRAYPSSLPPLVFPDDAAIRKVQDKGKISFQGQLLHVGRGFIGEHVGLLPSDVDGCLDVYYCQFKITTIDLRQTKG